MINVSEKDTVSIQTGDGSILGKWKTLAQTQCDYIDIRTMSQGILSGRHRGQRAKSRDPRNVQIGPHSNANGQRHRNTESTKQEAPSHITPLEFVTEHELRLIVDCTRISSEICQIVGKGADNSH